MKELRASMEVIRKEANSMITEIDGHLEDIRKEREQDRQLTAESVQQDAEYAFKVGDKFFTIQQVEDGYDYTFYDANLKELDGGVYDDPDITITGAMKEILKGEGLSLEDCRSISYKDFMEQKTSLDLQQGNELNGLNRAGIEETALNYAQSELTEMGVEQDIQMLGASVYGSRSRKGLYTPESDIDVVLSYSGDISEDSFFNILHEHEMKIGGMTLDINPISLEKTGTLEDYLKQADKYLDEKEIQKFAADLDAFAYRHDAYGYKDVIDNSDDSGIGAEAIRKDLMNGKIAPLREWLQELASGNVRVEDVVTAAQLRDRLEKIAEKQSEQTQPVPVYRLSFMEAQERGETDQWRASHWETKACAMEFNQDFGMAYHERRMPEFLQQMVDKYGMERCKIVLASTIQLADHDGRYYPSTKEEAAKVSIPNVDTSNENDRRLDYRADCHPVMVNSAFRELLTMEQEQSQEKAMSVIEQDEKAPPKSVLNRLREKQKQVASQKEKPARVQDKKRGVEL